MKIILLAELYYKKTLDKQLKNTHKLSFRICPLKRSPQNYFKKIFQIIQIIKEHPKKHPKRHMVSKLSDIEENKPNTDKRTSTF